jgi:hypothetical protein
LEDFMIEQTLFRSSEITVTTARLEVYGKMYLIAHITSIDSTEQKPDISKATSAYRIGILLTICSVVGASAHTDGILNTLGSTILFNLFIAAPTIAISRYYRDNQKTIYSIILKTASGETETLRTADEQTFASIQTALKNAIISQNSSQYSVDSQTAATKLEKIFSR